MKKFVVALIAIVGLTVSCVEPSVAVGYAQRAHPECSNFHKQNHSYDDSHSMSLTEVSMKCGEVSKSISVKCHFGWGIISETVCYENN